MGHTEIYLVIARITGSGTEIEDLGYLAADHYPRSNNTVFAKIRCVHGKRFTCNCRIADRNNSSRSGVPDRALPLAVAGTGEQNGRGNHRGRRIEFGAGKDTGILATVILPVALKVPVDGSKSSALADALARLEVTPPAIKTWPSGSSVAVCQARDIVILRVAVKVPPVCAMAMEAS